MPWWSAILYTMASNTRTSGLLLDFDGVIQMIDFTSSINQSDDVTGVRRHHAEPLIGFGVSGSEEVVRSVA